MGEEGVVSEKVEPVGNGKVEVLGKANAEGKAEAVEDNKGEQPDTVAEMEEDKPDEEKTEAQQMDVDKEEANGEKGEGETVTKEGGAEETEKQEEAEADEEKGEALKDGEKEEVKDGKMEEEAEEDTEKATEEKVKEDDGSKDVGDKPEELKEGKGSKKRPRSKTGGRRSDKTTKKEPAEVKKETEKVDKEQITPTPKKTKEPKTSVEKKEIEPKTPSAFSLERPVRERKSVERLVATIEKDASKDFRIEKGRGTALKDIPNVAYKLSRKKTEETFKMLHTILFGRRGKAAQVKHNISRFSGFVWHDNEEKQMNKVKEKLDKSVKEKLIEFCDVLDIPISKTSAKKEDIIVKLMEFFMEPHATTSDLLAEKEQGTKRKRSSKPAPGSATPTKGSVKSRKRVESDSKKHGEVKSTSPESEDESDEDKGEDTNGAQDRSEEMSDQAPSEGKGSESEVESDEDKGKKKAGSAKSSIKKGSSDKTKTKKVTISKKTSPPPKKLPAKSPDSSKIKNDSSAKKSSVKKKDEAVKKSSIPKKSPSNDSPGKKVLKVKQKPKEETLDPSDDDLRNSICKILKKVDFNTATFTDILKLLAKEYSTDLAARKSTVKLMIQEELTKLADADADAEGEEEDEGNVEKDEKAPSSKGVKAT
ncbi:hypothetical protein SASPL_154475 [Salvia splendens]|uniref:DEK-C domain-containing protein n=1 Tax=Salvia splendens TaxID=180675 RepID=A0A8X8W0A2_SALSN|nr:uncharacterized protein DDB_G0286299-like [Salvia splendens]XP_042041934.1 uncharacterized protein DDB_G0286299-like [Salvia splendens]XP_042041935.1 uncharacterized protein DDB_G0286299-like [Salvia splendens]KAG6385639.1 hypothetical protein SASPL_154475 [Salvia splendens]